MSEELTVFEERRKSESDSILLHIKELKATVRSLDAKMNYHHGVFREEVEKSVVGVFERSFPDGDPEGHRAHHEAMIKKAEAQAEFWDEMRLAAAKWAGLGVLGFLATAVWIAIKTEVHK